MARNKKGRNPNCTGSITKRKDGLYECKITVPGNGDGKKPRISKYFKTKKEAELFKAQVSRDIAAGQYVHSDIPVGEFLKEWYDNYTVNIRPSTRTNYKSYIENTIIPILGKEPLAKLTVGSVQRFFNNIKQNGSLKNKGAPLSDKTVKNIYAMFNQAMNQAVNNDLCKKNVLAGVVLPKSDPKKEMRVLSKDERAKLISVLDNIEEITVLKNKEERAKKSSVRYNEDSFGYRYIIFVSLYTGARIGEVLALEWSDIDFENKSITINKSFNRVYDFDNDTGNKTKLECGATKTYSGNRKIPMNDRLAQKLLEYKALQENLKEVLVDTYDDRGYLFTNQYGNRIESRTIQDFFKKLLKFADIEDANLHSLRHTFATQWLELGKDVKTLSRILGHSNITITLDLYVHSLHEHQANQIADFDY